MLWCRATQAEAIRWTQRRWHARLTASKAAAFPQQPTAGAGEGAVAPSQAKHGPLAAHHANARRSAGARSGAEPLDVLPPQCRRRTGPCRPAARRGGPGGLRRRGGGVRGVARGGQPWRGAAGAGWGAQHSTGALPLGRGPSRAEQSIDRVG